MLLISCICLKAKEQIPGEKVMDVSLLIHADHGMNASTFASLVVAATLSDIHSAITAGIAALKGPLHGGANEEVMKILLNFHSVEEAEYEYYGSPQH
jgi:citrate synthase